MWPFSPRNVPRTDPKPGSEAPSAPESYERRLQVIEGRVSELVSHVDDLQRSSRKDQLELLDIHERVKKSLAKLNRRAQEIETLEPETPGAETQTPQLDPSSQPHARLMTRRGR